MVQNWNAILWADNGAVILLQQDKICRYTFYLYSILTRSHPLSQASDNDNG
jgi:hypothetical protein